MEFFIPFEINDVPTPNTVLSNKTKCYQNQASIQKLCAYIHKRINMTCENSFVRNLLMIKI